MNSIVKAATRLSSMRSVLNPLRQALISSQSSSMANAGTSRQFTRTLWHMCSSDSSEILKMKKSSHMCSCGCSSQHKAVHTKAEKDLVDFLTEEISTEKKTQKKHGSIPTELDGFKVEADGAEVTLTKKSGNETVNIYFNVNHTVDADAEASMENNSNEPEFVEMKSEPGFEVELVRGSQTLGFTCSFMHPDQQNPEDEYQDIFSIDEVTMYEGEWKEKTYSVSGEVLDGNLYDLLMNLLEEKGVSNEFADKLSGFSTKYEHNLYVNLLEKLQKFANSK